MRITLRNPAPQPVPRDRDSKNLIISRLYNKKGDQKREHNPEDYGQKKASIHEFQTQPSSDLLNQMRPSSTSSNAQISTEGNTFLLNSFASVLSCEEQDPCWGFQNMKVRYRAVNKPQAKTLERNLLSQIYALQKKQSKPVNYLIETAHFGLPKIEPKRETKQNIINGFKIRNEPYLYPVYQNLGPLRRIEEPRRSKTESSLLYREQSRDVFENRAENQQGRASSHNYRYLRPANRVQTERARVQESRQVGTIRRQNSSANLLNNYNPSGYPIQNPQPLKLAHIQNAERSQKKLQQIRQQLHEIYNNRKTNSRSHCNLAYINKANGKMLGRGIGQGNYNHRLLLERSRNGSQV